MDNPESTFRKALAIDGIHPGRQAADWFILDGTEYSMTKRLPPAMRFFDEESGKLYCYLENPACFRRHYPPRGDFDVRLPLAGEVGARKDPGYYGKGRHCPAANGRIPNGGKWTVSLFERVFLSPVRAYATVRIEMKEGQRTFTGRTRYLTRGVTWC